MPLKTNVNCSYCGTALHRSPLQLKVSESKTYYCDAMCKNNDRTFMQTFEFGLDKSNCLSYWKLNKYTDNDQVAFSLFIVKTTRKEAEKIFTGLQILEELRAQKETEQK